MGKVVVTILEFTETPEGCGGTAGQLLFAGIGVGALESGTLVLIVTGG